MSSDKRFSYRGRKSNLILHVGVLMQVGVAFFFPLLFKHFCDVHFLYSTSELDLPEGKACWQLRCSSHTAE